MRVIPTEIPGAFVVEPEPVVDARGSFARWFDAEAFEANGLVTAFDQDSIADNALAGTLRGMHVQQAGWAETKLVLCVRGAAFDVIVDLRDGPTYGKHICVESRGGYVADRVHSGWLRSWISDAAGSHDAALPDRGALCPTRIGRDSLE